MVPHLEHTGLLGLMVDVLVAMLMVVAVFVSVFDTVVTAFDNNMVVVAVLVSVSNVVVVLHTVFDIDPGDS